MRVNMNSVHISSSFFRQYVDVLLLWLSAAAFGTTHPEQAVIIARFKNKNLAAKD